MKFRIYLLRQRGRRLPWRDAQNGHSYIGTLVTHLKVAEDSRYTVLEVQPSDPMSDDRPPPLFEPVIVAFAPNAFRLRGFERAGSDVGVVQEWHVEDP
jgi:hypothetical protein